MTKETTTSGSVQFSGENMAAIQPLLFKCVQEGFEASSCTFLDSFD